MFAFIGMPGPMEMAVIGVIAVLLFGNRLPSVARSCGQSLLSFKAGMKDIEREIDETERETKKALSETSKATKEVLG